MAVPVAEASTGQVAEEGADAVAAGDDACGHDGQAPRTREVEDEEEHEEAARRADETTGGEDPDDAGERAKRCGRGHGAHQTTVSIVWKLTIMES